jgi:hypothetical protein
MGSVRDDVISTVLPISFDSRINFSHRRILNKKEKRYMKLFFVTILQRAGAVFLRSLRKIEDAMLCYAIRCYIMAMVVGTKKERNREEGESEATGRRDLLYAAVY